LALLLALATVYAVLGTAGLYLVERHGTRTLLRFHLAAMFAIAAVAVVVSRGQAFLLFMPLVVSGVLFLCPTAAAVIVASCSAVTLAVQAFPGSSVTEFPRDAAGCFAALIFLPLISRIPG